MLVGFLVGLAAGIAVILIVLFLGSKEGSGDFISVDELSAFNKASEPAYTDQARPEPHEAAGSIQPPGPDSPAPSQV